MVKLKFNKGKTLDAIIYFQRKYTLRKKYRY